ncbi:MAG: PEGA domain-containing protein [Vicinamibacterales bacterium]
MTPNRLLTASLLAVVSLSFWPADAQAQRRAVRVARPPTTVIVTGYPRYYDPWWPYGWYGPYSYGQRYYYDGASVRLQVDPRTAEVYVDGYFAGNVDDFDGAFQRLRVEPGEHEIAVWADGYRTLRRRLYIQPLSTVTIKDALERVQPGDVQETRPAAPAEAESRPVPGPPTRRPERNEPRPRPDTRTPDRPDSAPAPRAGAQEDSNFGVLSVRVQPGGADVLIDGERWDGPNGDERLLVQLAPGNHRLEVRREGFQTFTRTLEIRAGATETVNVSLTRQ